MGLLFKLMNIYLIYRIIVPFNRQKGVLLTKEFNSFALMIS